MDDIKCIIPLICYALLSISGPAPLHDCEIIQFDKFNFSKIPFMSTEMKSLCRATFVRPFIPGFSKLNYLPCAQEFLQFAWQIHPFHKPLLQNSNSFEHHIILHIVNDSFQCRDMAMLTQKVIISRMCFHLSVLAQTFYSRHKNKKQ